MNPDMLVFNKALPNKDVIDEALSFEVRKLEQTDGITLSQYSISLSQYLIFFRAEYNRTRAEASRKQRFVDSTVTQLITKEILKQYKTKTDAKAYLVANVEVLSNTVSELETLIYEQHLLEGMDKTITELIACFKRELTRRENEMYAIRKDR